MKIHGKEYTEVKDRIVLFLKDHPKGNIVTEIQWSNEDFSKVCIKAFVFKEPQSPPTTGFAYEERVSESKEVNYSSWVENCETSAIGRALANMNIGVGDTRPSAEEMQKVERMSVVDTMFTKEYDTLLQALDTTDFKSVEGLMSWVELNKPEIDGLSEGLKSKLRSKVKSIKTKLEKV